MGKTRLEAFSDGVIAIIITIMVLELKVPHGHELADLRPMLPILLAYVLSFIFVGIYWNNHHHMIHLCSQVNGRIMWANLHLLFWLSLVPATTAWVGENPHATAPTAVYGLDFLMCGVAWLFLERAILKVEGRDSALAQAVGNDFKGKLSAALYLTGVALSFVAAWIAQLIYVLVATLWLIPDPRIERHAKKS